MPPFLPAPHRRGFSLLQALICVAIIAVLTAILIPTISSARAQARAVTCISNLRQIDQAFSGRQSSAAMRLPGATEWISIVAQSADNASAVLSCPDGANPEHAEVPGAYFHSWFGNTRGNPASSRLAGSAPWRPTRRNISDNVFELSYALRPNRPDEVLTIRYERLGGGEMWRASVVREPANYRTDCFIVSTGMRHANITTGFTVDYAFDHAVDYGFNVIGERLISPSNDKILVMDYNHTIIDFDGYPLSPANNDDVASTSIPVDRHRKTVNALMSDGSVRTFHPVDLQPSSELYTLARRGPRPGGALPDRRRPPPGQK